MGSRQEKRRHPFPRSHVMAHAFVDALIDADSREVKVHPAISRAVARGVERITRQRKAKPHG